jgi:hypothetical protein
MPLKGNRPVIIFLINGAIDLILNYRYEDENFSTTCNSNQQKNLLAYEC